MKNLLIISEKVKKGAANAAPPACQKSGHCKEVAVPKPRFSRVSPFITCTKWQVGRLLPSSLLPTSDAQVRREACNPKAELFRRPV